MTESDFQLDQRESPTVEMEEENKHIIETETVKTGSVSRFSDRDALLLTHAIGEL
jgi:hypothetical protein